MMLQLNPPIPVTTPKGPALAHFIIDDGPETDLQWVCFQTNTGECWTWRNRFIRAEKNLSLGREYISPFYDPDDVAFPKQEKQEATLNHNIHLKCDCGFFDWVPYISAKYWKCPACEDRAQKDLESTLPSMEDLIQPNYLMKDSKPKENIPAHPQADIGGASGGNYDPDSQNQG